MVLGLACEGEGSSGDDAPADPESGCTPGPNPSLEIGQGETAYAPLAEGETMELIHGSQGGVHVLVALEARDIDPGEMLEGEIRGYVDGEQLGASYPYLFFRCNPDADAQQVWNLFLIWDAQPEDIHMKTVEIEVELTDQQGVMLSASKSAVIDDPLL